MLLALVNGDHTGRDNMALEFGYTTRHGVTSSKAYHKITNIIYNANQSPNTVAEIRIYNTKTDADNGLDELDKMTFSFTMGITSSDRDPVSQAYLAVRKIQQVTDNRGRSRSIDYKSKSVKDV